MRKSGRLRILTDWLKVQRSAISSMLKKGVKWSTLRGVENLRVVKSMYVWLFVVPIAAKTTSRLNESYILSLFDAKFEITFQLPFSWEIFYFSALAFVLGNLTFLARCPGLLKDHDSYTSFHADGKGEIQLSLYAAELKKPGPDEAAGSLIRDPAAALEAYRKAIEDRDRHFFWFLYHGADRVRLMSLYLCATFYGLGFGLITWVLYENFTYVWAYLGFN